MVLQESLEDVKKRKDKLEVELLEARALSVTATRNVERLERYEGEGASEDEEEGETSFDCFLKCYPEGKLIM